MLTIRWEITWGRSRRVCNARYYGYHTDNIVFFFFFSWLLPFSFSRYEKSSCNTAAFITKEKNIPSEGERTQSSRLNQYGSFETFDIIAFNCSCSRQRGRATQHLSILDENKWCCFVSFPHIASFFSPIADFLSTAIRVRACSINKKLCLYRAIKRWRILLMISRASSDSGSKRRSSKYTCILRWVW